MREGVRQLEPARRRSAAGRDETELLSRRTELVLRELDALPTLPAVATRLMAIGANEEADIREIVRLIEADPTLTARLLSLCRKAAMRTRYPITTVEMAVVMLGLEAVRALVLSVQIFDWTASAPRRSGLSSRGGGPRGRRGGGSGRAEPDEPVSRFNRVGFWQHSIAVACCADLIAREHPDLDFHPEEAFVCGLVHDLGKLALDLVLPRAYGRVIELSEAREGNIADFERPIVGLDHHAAGRKLAERWGLPEVFLDVVSQHGLGWEQIPEGPHRRMVGLIALSDAVCRRLCLGWSGNHAAPADEASLARRAGFNAERIEALVPRLYEATSGRCRDLGLGEEPSQQLLVESIMRANARLGRLNQDLSEANRALERAQRELAETRSMTRLGEMAAGAAHEMNNPLTVISGRAQSLAERLKDEKDRQLAGAIVDASGRLTELIGRLHRIAKPPQPRREPTSVVEMMEEVIKRAKARAGARGSVAGQAVIGVKLTVAEGLEPARLDREVMTDALVEVVVNAIESGPRGPVEVRVYTEGPEDRLIIQTSDDGTGMSEHALEHAMDPFFSEKAAGRQPGLGLALAHRLVSAHGGEIALSSRPGRGTVATVSIGDWRCSREAGGRSNMAA